MQFMDTVSRTKIAERLSKKGRIYIGKESISARNGLVYIETTAFPKNPLDTKLFLDNPMTWDTFTHIYLLDKGSEIIK